MRYAKVVACLGVMILPFAGMVVAGEGLSNKLKGSSDLTGDLLKKLKFETTRQTSPAPDFSLKDSRGNLVSLLELRGKVVLVNFWASWCPACNLEFASMEALHRKLGNKGLVIVAINFREAPEEVVSFVHKQGLSFRVVLDRNGETFDRYQTWSLPTSYLIGKNGNLLGKAIGYREWDSAAALAAFRHLLNDPS